MDTSHYESGLSRRDFFGHVGALGLGAAFVAVSGTVKSAPSAKAKDLPQVPGLIFEKFEAGGISHYSYFIGDPISGVAVIIDPKRDIDDYLEMAEKHRLKITHAIDTHIHADFVTGTRELNHRVGSASCASIEGGAEYGFPIKPLRHGDIIEAGNIRLQVIHTPGHTPEHISLLASTKSASDKYWALFTGDFLFAGSVGRPDLMGVENTDKLAHLLYDSLQNSYKDLPDELPIFPAHGPGSPCGAGILDRGETPTLGIERKSNPAMQFSNADAFIDNLLKTQPPIPYYWPRMKQVNAKGPEILGGIPDPQAYGPKEFKNLLADKEVQLLDTRNMLGFGGGHIPGALNIGYSDSITMWGGWLLDPNRPVAIITPDLGKPQEVARWLVRVGLEKFAGTLQGGMNAWTRQAGDLASIDQIPVQELKKLTGNPDYQILDVRQPSEWDQGHLPNAKYMFLPELPERMNELDPSRPVIAYCGTGYRASIAASLLKGGGFNVSSVPGSFEAWLAAKYDVVVPDSPGKASDTRRS